VSDDVVAALVEASAVRALRREVLRPGRPLDESVFGGDSDLLAAHVALGPVGWRADSTDLSGQTLAVGTVYPCPPPWEPSRTDGWRIRGMATRQAARGRGLGGIVLDTLLAHVASHGGGLVWCNARTAALGLYRRAGFTGRGEEFVVPGIGPHLRMWRTVEPAGT
jgi:GNAT superfamily N-acetyltransferase